MLLPTVLCCSNATVQYGTVSTLVWERQAAFVQSLVATTAATFPAYVVQSPVVRHYTWGDYLMRGWVPCGRLCGCGKQSFLPTKHVE